MALVLNDTHDPNHRSWVDSANEAGCDFPIQNLPHGVFSAEGGKLRGGIAIGDQILDIQAVLSAGLVPPEIIPIAQDSAASTLNALAARGNTDASRLRAAIFDLLRAGSEQGAKARAHAGDILVPMAAARLHMPLAVGNFTDFMTSVYHVTSARRSRPARELNENFLYLPVAYNGRSSSITEDAVDFPRPWGQRKEDGGEIVFAPSNKMDFEIEFAAVVGRPNELGRPIALDQAEDHIFGYVLMNDWSARDIQFWEMRLGPFLGKAFRTTISPWIVTSEALLPFRGKAPVRKPEEPQYLPYLTSARHKQHGGLAVELWGELETEAMREAGLAPCRIVTTNLAHCSWTLQQMLTHHASGGCNMQPGDLISSGTVSGPTDEAAACLFELTAGTVPVELPTGEERNWLEDGDRFVIGGRARKAGFATIGFGSCGATLLPAVDMPG
jgi:fumarylacetoacetase